jgi:hypothetical protein
MHHRREAANVALHDPFASLMVLFAKGSMHPTARSVFATMMASQYVDTSLRHEVPGQAFP